MPVRLSKLKRLWLGHTPVSKDAAEQLKAALPKCAFWGVGMGAVMTTTKPNRCFLRFSLRTLLLFMFVVCVATRCELTRRRANQQREAVAWVENLGGTARYDAEPSGPDWLRRRLGRDFFDEAEYVNLANSPTDVTPLSALKGLKALVLCDNRGWRTGRGAGVDLTPLAGLTRLTHLDLGFTQASDASPLAGLIRLEWLSLSHTRVQDVSPLAGLTYLEALDLCDTNVSDVAALSGLEHLKELNLVATDVCDLTPLASLGHLKRLEIHHTDVTDLTPLAKLKNLEFLGLRDTQVGDVVPLSQLTSLKQLNLDRTRISDVAPLAGLSSLRLLFLSGTKVSSEAVGQLKRALPQCEIIH